MRELLRLGLVLAEKCALEDARRAFREAFERARHAGDVSLTAEGIARLLRMASESRDWAEINVWERELKALMASFPSQIPSTVWYCQAVLSGQKEQWRQAQTHLLQYLRALDHEPESAPLLGKREATARAWVMLANTFAQRGHLRRAERLLNWVRKEFEPDSLPSINGLVYLQQGWLNLRRRDAQGASGWIDKAHAAFLAGHNWYNHLFVLYAYACLARIQSDYPKAQWYLELLERATEAPGFDFFREQIQRERSRLQQDAVDLHVDGRKLQVRTRESHGISLGKQYVLLHILEALSEAHQQSADYERGLSKSELIERVWGERYRPLAHDNKLYYNINRLRRLIEPDMKQPRYLLNWKEGYRLAPGLRVQVVGANNPLKKKMDRRKGGELS
ncbi:MAG: helix-turn-helix domain-containing protein [Bdellovibrionales bacterium]|nr:helix-turn-helix domain-containing protein [Bdellovibrionales bacterium]